MTGLVKLTRFAHELDSSVKVCVKEQSLLMRGLNVFMRLFNRRFMTDYATTVGHVVYIPGQWIREYDSGARDLRPLMVHEVAGHVRQCRNCAFGLHPLFGVFLYTLLYALLPLPLYLAFFRYLFELEADAEAWDWMLRNGYSPHDVRLRAARFGEIVGGWDYLKPLPGFVVMRGFMRRVEDVIISYHNRPHGL